MVSVLHQLPQQPSGASIIAITPQGADGIEKTSEEIDNAISLLNDPGGQIMSDYKIVFQVTDKYNNKIKLSKGSSLEKMNDQETAKLPVPATFIINQEGVIIDRHFDYNYKTRYSVKAILEALRQ